MVNVKACWVAVERSRFLGFEGWDVVGGEW